MHKIAMLGTYSLAGALAGFGGFLVVGNRGVVFIALGQPFLFPSIAAVAVGGTLSLVEKAVTGVRWPEQLC